MKEILSLFLEIEVESEVLFVAENELVELSAQKKFDDLLMIMKELVKQEVESESEIKLEAIKISNFKLVPQQGFEIYYNLKQ